jgi:DMSO/TMAO reductase YedYZ heme-binding membrane subunit
MSAAPLGAPRRDRFPPLGWLALGVCVGATVWLGIARSMPAGPDVLPTVNRWLVRVGLPLFFAAFAASSLARLWPSPFTRRLVRERRGLGVAWAAIHLTHALAILSTWRGEGGEVPPLRDVAIGGLGFAFTFAMLVTSTDAAQRALGRGWSRLHRTGIWLLAFIYAASYAGNLASEPTLWKAIALGTLLGLVALRFVAWRRGRVAPAGALPVAGG